MTEQDQADLLDAVKGQTEILRGLLKRVSRATYKNLPDQVRAISRVIRTNVQVTPGLESTLSSLELRTLDFVSLVDTLGLKAEPGQPTFDGIGGRLLEVVEDLDRELQQANLTPRA